MKNLTRAGKTTQKMYLLLSLGVHRTWRSYALYSGGEIGVIQEFYIDPEHRASGLGSMLVEQVKAHGVQQNWSYIELCTPLCLNLSAP